jgi:hypothetical protein
MIDIVERIEAEREARAVDPMRPANPILADAKDEIVRLRAELDAAPSSAGTAEPVGYVSPITLQALRELAEGTGFIVAAPAYDTLIPVYTHPAPAVTASVREAPSEFSANGNWDALAHVRFLRGQGGASSGFTADLIERLFLSLSTGPTREDGAGKWQPIETAPKDRPFIGRREDEVYKTKFGREYVKWPHEEGGPTFREVWNRVLPDSIFPWKPTYWLELLPAVSSTERQP